MPQAILTPLPAGFSPWTIYTVQKTIIHREQARTVKNLKKRRMASTLKVKTHKIFKNCKVRWSLKTQAMYSCTNGASLVSEDSLLPQEHRTNLHNNQTHMVLNHLCSAFPFPKYHFRIYPVPLSSGKMDEPPSVLSSSALENQNVRNWKTTIPSFGGGKLTWRGPAFCPKWDRQRKIDE